MKQVEINKTLERAFTAVVKLQDLKERYRFRKFITPQYYPIRTLIENLSFSSTVFRHSLRLTITILIGFYYWKNPTLSKCLLDVLTIVVIIDGDTVTKQRTFQRIFGTILGGLLLLEYFFSFMTQQSLVD
jgi:uncharacterized membrane protein YccC